MKKVLKWVGIVLGGLIGLILIAAVAIFVISDSTVNKHYDITAEDITIPTDAESIARGKHIVETRDCTDCHGDNLGGQELINDPNLAVITSKNLTPGEGGAGSEFTDADWIRAIRHGVDENGRALYIMPSEAFWYFSDEDLGAVIAYLKTLPPVDNVTPERQFGPIGRFGLVMGMFPPPPAAVIDHNARPPIPEVGVTAAYGEYLHWGCTGCHRANMAGGPLPEDPTIIAANLTPGGELAGWTEEDFVTAIRTGITPSGHELSENMPWRTVARMTDDELSALWLYLKSLPAADTPEK